MLLGLASGHTKPSEKKEFYTEAAEDTEFTESIMPVWRRPGPLSHSLRLIGRDGMAKAEDAHQRSLHLEEFLFAFVLFLCAVA